MFRLLAGMGNTKSLFRKMDEQIFEALLKGWGFKKTRSTPDPFIREYLREIEANLIIYTLSGGPMVVFELDGTFEEWA